MGHDSYETPTKAADSLAKGLPPMGIGKNSFVEKAIVDKNARIGENVRITAEGKPMNLDGKNFYMRDGIVVIPKGAVIPSNTVI